jgi:hypothetical protein
MRRAVLATGVAVWLGFVACARVIAPPPPETSPTVELDTLMAGHPLMLAGKAARVLVDNQYITRRFGRDSTWGYQSTDKISVRFRYVQRGDSTRVHLQGWGRCDASVCVRNDLQMLLAALAAEEAAPQ